MQHSPNPLKKQYLRPIVVAAFFTVPGQLLPFLMLGIKLHSYPDIVPELVLSVVGGTLTAVAIGLMVGFIVGGRYSGPVAASIASLCYAMVAVAAILIAYEIDMQLDHPEVRHNPMPFIGSAVIAILITMPLYGWLLHSRPGKALLNRLGL